MIPAQHALESADIVTSSDDYARRFSGDIGQWLLEIQAKTLKELLKGRTYRSALDVGGGHGQLVAPLNELGIKPAILASDSSCTRQIESALRNQQCSFITGNLTAIPCPKDSMDLVTCIRFISHCEDWRKLIAELCRVARHAVIIDYPPLISSNLLAPVTFRIKKRIEGNTRPYSIFLHREIEQEFARHGYRLSARQGQFLFPMAIHRLAKSRYFSDTIERASSVFGLRSQFGSPTLAIFETGAA